MIRIYKENATDAKQRRDYRRQFDGSHALFDYCWRSFLKASREGAVIDDIAEYLEAVASEQVNNPDSKFYIYG